MCANGRTIQEYKCVRTIMLTNHAEKLIHIF